MVTPAKMVVCLDVAFSNTGVAVWNCRLREFVFTDVIVTHGTPKKKRTGYVADENIQRCQTIAGRLATIMARYKPRHVIAEMPHGGARQYRSGVCMAMALAVVSTTCKLRGVPLYPTQPGETKRIISLKGEVTKSAVIRHVEKKFGVTLTHRSLNEHVADAMMCVEVARRRMIDLIIE